MIGGKITRVNKQRYISLYKLFTSRDAAITNEEYIEMAYDILNVVKDESIAYIADLEYDEPTLISMREQIEEMYASVDRSDLNLIAMINIFSLQCIIVFNEATIRKPQYTHPDHSKIFDEIIKTCEWQNYANLKHCLDQSGEIISRLIPLIETTYKDYIMSNNATGRKNYITLITIIDFFPIEYLLNTFLNNVFYLGFVNKYTVVDGKLGLPMDFLNHDLSHADDYINRCNKLSPLKMKELTDFCSYYQNYNHYEMNIADIKQQKYCISLIIFLLIHESALCIYFDLEKREILR